LSVWIDGINQPDDGNFNNLDIASQISVSSNSVVAASCTDQIPGIGFNVRGLLASTNLGGTTNTVNWKCSQTLEPGWQRPSYDDSQWISPSSFRNGVSPVTNGAALNPWHIVQGIALGAEWIWIGSSDSSNGPPSKIYCRYYISSQINKIEGANKSVDKGCSISKTCEMMNGTACFMPGMEKKDTPL